MTEAAPPPNLRRARLLFATIVLAATGIAFSFLWKHRQLELRRDGRGVPSIVRSATPMSRTLGICEPHDRYGWIPIPGARRRHRTEEYDVRYKIDGLGFRVTPGPPVRSPGVLCLGGSYTFGHGVNDREAWPAQISGAGKVANAGVQGWGTAQSLLRLEDELDAGLTPDIVLYALFRDHVVRNTPNRIWLDRQVRMGVRAPVLIAPAGAWRFDHLTDPDEPATGTDDLEAITLSMIRQMMARTHAAGARFAVVFLRAPDAYEHELGLGMADRIRSAGIPLIDTRGGPGRHYERDWHPMPEMQAGIAEIVSRALAEGLDAP